MTDLALDMDKSSAGYGDLLLTNGDLVLVNGEAEVRQVIKETLGVMFGEWFMDNTIGIDYFGQILVKNPNMGKINAIILSAVLSVPGVLQILSYSFVPDYVARRISITFTAQTTSGVVVYSG